MTKLHRNLLETKWLQVKEVRNVCCCVICYAKCLSLSLLPLVAGGSGGAVMVAPWATSSRGDNQTAGPEDSNDMLENLF